MKKILKYPLLAGQHSVVYMPEGSEILDVDHQWGKLHLWAICDETKPLAPYSFKVLGTGFELPEVHEYEKWHLKTVHCRDQGLVWHVFDMNKPIW